MASRNRNRKPLVIVVAAHEIQPGDYIHGEGIVNNVRVKGCALLKVAGSWRMIPKDERLPIHLEDTGLET